jgi:RNA polymerase sigma factor (sigma-70 family)
MAVSSEGGALAAYRTQLSCFPPLRDEEERELTRAWRAGDKRAGDRLVCACLPFVVSIAMEYRRWGVPLEDIIQQGNIGLLRAAKRFDPAKECRLITYAAYWVRAEIRDYVVRGYRVVRFGTTKSERRALRLYRTTREDNPAALAAQSGLSEAQAERLLPLLASTPSRPRTAARASSAWPRRGPRPKTKRARPSAPCARGPSSRRRWPSCRPASVSSSRSAGPTTTPSRSSAWAAVSASARSGCDRSKSARGPSFAFAWRHSTRPTPPDGSEVGPPWRGNWPAVGLKVVS